MRASYLGSRTNSRKNGYVCALDPKHGFGSLRNRPKGQINAKKHYNMGRPPVLPKKKKDGFWLEVRNKGAKSGTILIRESHNAMMQAAKQYEMTKDVILMGEHKNGKKVDSEKAKAKKAKEAKEAKEA